MRRAGDILRVFLDHATAEKAERYQGFFSSWEAVVGERIAAHSQIKDVDNGIIIVEVDHPGWMQMIQLKQSRFVDILRRKYPDLEIRGMRLQLPWDTRPVSAVSTDGATRGAPPRSGRRQEGATAAADASDLPDPSGPTDDEEAPADPLIRGALERLGRAIDEREKP